MQLIHSLQMEGFYGSVVVNHISVCASVCVSVELALLYYVCNLLEADSQDASVKIKLSLFRLQCKSAHGASHSGKSELGSCVGFCCLIGGCPWQQQEQQAHTSSTMDSTWYLPNLWAALLQRQSPVGHTHEWFCRR